MADALRRERDLVSAVARVAHSSDLVALGTLVLQNDLGECAIAMPS
jgi:hypothetical protein